ncbi:MAG TPA: response regulator [Microvirga sp.]|jgi:CheY-like chemotaxis protein|nr:response regulator [Microvirga sp.]
MRVLVVDDDTAVRSLTARAIRSAGHEVTEAEDGVEALRLLDAGMMGICELEESSDDATRLQACWDQFNGLVSSLQASSKRVSHRDITDAVWVERTVVAA